MTATVPMTVAMTTGMNRGEKETRAVIPGQRQKSQGKYKPVALDTYSIYGAKRVETHTCALMQSHSLEYDTMDIRYDLFLLVYMYTLAKQKVFSLEFDQAPYLSVCLKN